MPVASCIKCGSDFYYDEDDTFEHENVTGYVLCVTCPCCMNTIGWRNTMETRDISILEDAVEAYENAERNKGTYIISTVDLMIATLCKVVLALVKEREDERED